MSADIILQLNKNDKVLSYWNQLYSETLRVKSLFDSRINEFKKKKRSEDEPKISPISKEVQEN